MATGYSSPSSSKECASDMNFCVSCGNDYDRTIKFDVTKTTAGFNVVVHVGEKTYNVNITCGASANALSFAE